MRKQFQIGAFQDGPVRTQTRNLKDSAALQGQENKKGKDLLLGFIQRLKRRESLDGIFKMKRKYTMAEVNWLNPWRERVEVTRCTRFFFSFLFFFTTSLPGHQLIKLQSLSRHSMLLKSFPSAVKTKSPVLPLH